METTFNRYTVEKRRRKKSHVKKPQELSEEARGCPALRQESDCSGNSTLASNVPSSAPEEAESVGVGTGGAGEEELPRYRTSNTEKRREACS